MQLDAANTKNKNTNIDIDDSYSESVEKILNDLKTHAILQVGLQSKLNGDDNNIRMKSNSEGLYASLDDILGNTNDNIDGDRNVDGVNVVAPGADEATHINYNTGNQGESDHDSTTDVNDENGNNCNNIMCQEWSRNDLLIWLKLHLIKHGFDSAKIYSFLQEFGKKNVTGKKLLIFKNDESMLNTFITQFSNDNQSSELWNCIKKEIQQLG